MSTAATQAVDIEQSLVDSFCEAVCEDLKLLAVLNGNELTAEMMTQLKQIDFPMNFGLVLSGQKIKSALTTLNLSVSNWQDSIKQEEKDILDMDFAGIYLNHAYRASPEESVWIDEENLAMQEPMFQVRECYKRYGLEAENWRIRPDDHLVTQLQFVAYVLSSNTDLDTLKDIANFLDEHILRWVVSFAERAAVHCETPYYASLVLVTAYYVEELRDLLALILNEPRPSKEEIDKKMKPRAETVIKAMKYVPGTAESW